MKNLEELEKKEEKKEKNEGLYWKLRDLKWLYKQEALCNLYTEVY